MQHHTTCKYVPFHPIYTYICFTTHNNTSLTAPPLPDLERGDDEAIQSPSGCPLPAVTRAPQEPRGRAGLKRRGHSAAGAAFPPFPLRLFPPVRVCQCRDPVGNRSLGLGVRGQCSRAVALAAAGRPPHKRREPHSLHSLSHFFHQHETARAVTL